MRRLILLVASCVGLAAPVLAQSPRPGMRLTVTRVAPTGGYTAHGLLVVHATTVTRAPAPECGVGALRIDARGQDARGRIRDAHVVTIATPTVSDVAVGPGPCEARVEVVLDDGTSVSVTRGTLHGQLVGARGLDAEVDGSALDASGVPITVGGHIVLSGG